ncbi:MAG: SagB/ThcOx family dehydrogenase [Solirubrobacterales bacterium]
MTDFQTPRRDNPFQQAETLGSAICELAEEHGLPSENAVQAMTAIMNSLVVEPNSVFPDPPSYIRELRPVQGEIALPTRSTHQFFDVVKGRASRRDFGTDPLELSRLEALLVWTMGCRSETIAYDWRGAPQRYIPSAGGLASVDAYVIANQIPELERGSYYFDYRQGLVPISKGYMAQKVADLMPGQDWVARAAAVVIFVGNIDRLTHKYGAMAFKLMMLDAGVAVGHAELVATALELRATVLGGLPAAELKKLLRLDGDDRVPLATLTVGTRSGHE